MGYTTASPSAFISRILITLILSNCGVEQPKNSPVWVPVPEGMVLTRNFMVPESPKKEGYYLLADKYRLGSKAYGRKLPAWWSKMVADAKVSEKWHPKDFPLAYAGEFRSKDGANVLLVVQTSQAFTGDGFYSPGPVVYLVARLFTIGKKGPELLKEEAFSIGSFQYCRLLAGKANGRQIVFESESGSQFDSRAVTNSAKCIIDLDEDNKLSKKGLDHF